MSQKQHNYYLCYIIKSYIDTYYQYKNYQYKKSLSPSLHSLINKEIKSQLQ